MDRRRRWGRDAQASKDWRQEWETDHSWGHGSQQWETDNHQGRSRGWQDWKDNGWQDHGRQDDGWQTGRQDNGWQGPSGDQEASAHSAAQDAVQEAVQSTASGSRDGANDPQSRQGTGIKLFGETPPPGMPQATTPRGKLERVEGSLATYRYHECAAGADVNQATEGNRASVADANVQISQDSADRNMFDLDYFRNFREFTDGYKQHNIAMKWFREFGETQETARVDMDNSGPMQVPICDHPKGMHWTFDTTRTKPWRWQEMVAQLDLESTRHVVEGPQLVDLNSMTAVAETCEKPCLIECYLAKTDKYDHKRHAAFGRNRIYHIWDFVLERNNGTRIWLHPDYKSTKITSYEGDSPSDHEVPASGKGGTSGPGTYKHFKWKHNEKTLRFDPGRRN